MGRLFFCLKILKNQKKVLILYTEQYIIKTVKKLTNKARHKSERRTHGRRRDKVRIYNNFITN